MTCRARGCPARGGGDAHIATPRFSPRVSPVHLKDDPDHIVSDLHSNAVARCLTVISGNARLDGGLINGVDMILGRRPVARPHARPDPLFRY